MKDLSQSIGERIAELRKEQHMTQAELAEYLDISVKHCSSVERGLSRLSLEKMIEVADLFHTSLDYLICGRCAPGQYADLFPASLQRHWIPAMRNRPHCCGVFFNFTGNCWK